MTRRADGKELPIAESEEPSVRFDARARLRGRYDDATVADVAGVDS